MVELKSHEVIMSMRPIAGQNGEGVVVMKAEKVTELVRCKDCKWYERGMSECHNPRYGDGWANYPSPQVYDEYYCGDGERKDEVKE